MSSTTFKNNRGEPGRFYGSRRSCYHSVNLQFISVTKKVLAGHSFPFEKWENIKYPNKEV